MLRRVVCDVLLGTDESLVDVHRCPYVPVLVYPMMYLKLMQLLSGWQWTPKRY